MASIDITSFVESLGPDQSPLQTHPQLVISNSLYILHRQDSLLCQGVCCHSFPLFVLPLCVTIFFMSFEAALKLLLLSDFLLSNNQILTK